jgi:predicted phosphodiesterase
MSRAAGFQINANTLAVAFRKLGLESPARYCTGDTGATSEFLGCSVHPQYQAKRQPVANCEACWRIWLNRETSAPPQRSPEVYGGGQRFDAERDELRAGEPIPTPRNPAQKERFARLMDAVRRGPVGFQSLCDRLDLSPAKTKDLISEARDSGYRLDVAHDQVAYREAGESTEIVEVGPVAPVTGERQRVGVISDTHFGSKYCLRPQIRDFVEYAYEQGVREILYPGDVLDGIYRHGVFELTHSGLEDQIRDCIETLPHLDGLHYHAIMGNHDHTFTEHTGVNVGKVIQGQFRDAGREDFHPHGDRGAYLKVRGALVHLWHPRGSGSYAQSYQIQKKIESYTSIKPQILLCGHWHIFCHVDPRGVHGIACPTFQGGQSEFGKSLKTPAPAIGGMILQWQQTEHGTIRRFSLERCTYYERERVVEIHADMDGVAIKPQTAHQAAVWE